MDNFNRIAILLAYRKSCLLLEDHPILEFMELDLSRKIKHLSRKDDLQELFYNYLNIILVSEGMCTKIERCCNNPIEIYKLYNAEITQMNIRKLLNLSLQLEIQFTDGKMLHRLLSAIVSKEILEDFLIEDVIGIIMKYI